MLLFMPTEIQAQYHNFPFHSSIPNQTNNNTLLQGYINVYT